jgi:hypothetical protein
MKLNREQLKKLILEEMKKIEEAEIPAVVQAPTGGQVASTAQKEPEPEAEAGQGQMPPDVERDLKVGFATKFDELVKDNINTPTEATAFIGAMVDLMEKVPPEVAIRVLKQELTNRQKMATS